MSVGVTGTFGVTWAFGVIGALEKSPLNGGLFCALVRRDEGREWDRGAIFEG